MIQFINLFISKFQSGNRVRLALELLIRIIFQLSKGKKNIYTRIGNRYPVFKCRRKFMQISSWIFRDREMEIISENNSIRQAFAVVLITAD